MTSPTKEITKTFLQSRVEDIFKGIARVEGVICDNPIDSKQMEGHLKLINDFKAGFFEIFDVGKKQLILSSLKSKIDTLKFDDNVGNRILQAYDKLVDQNPDPGNSLDIVKTNENKMAKRKKQNVEQALKMLSGLVLQLQAISVKDFNMTNIDNPDRETNSKRLNRDYRAHKAFEELRSKNKVNENPSQFKKTIRAQGVTLTMQKDEISVPKKFSSLTPQQKKDIAEEAALAMANGGFTKVTIYMKNYQNRRDDVKTFLNALTEKGFLLENIYICDSRKNKKVSKVKVQDAKTSNGEALLSQEEIRCLNDRAIAAKERLEAELTQEETGNILEEAEASLQDSSTLVSPYRSPTSSTARILSGLGGVRRLFAKDAQRSPIATAADYVLPPSAGISADLEPNSSGGQYSKEATNDSKSGNDQRMEETRRNLKALEAKAQRQTEAFSGDASSGNGSSPEPEPSTNDISQLKASL